MIHTDTKILSLAAALLLCFGTYALAAPPEGKGGGKGGKGNQPIAATADFTAPDVLTLVEIMSNVPLQGEFIDNGGFDTLGGQLAGGETITVTGDAGGALVYLAAIVLPAAGVNVQPGMVTFNADSGVTWKIRLDRDKQPENRVQFKMRWLNDDGLEHHLRIGWVVQAYEDEIYPLPTDEYGEVTDDGTSLASATVIFDTDFFRIDGEVVVLPIKGKKTKTEPEVFSHYGEVNSASAPWCNMGDAGPCVASTVIQTALN